MKNEEKQRKLVTVDAKLRKQLVAYIERDDVCVSVVERANKMASGTLKRFADGKTFHTREATVAKIRSIVSQPVPVAPVRTKLDPDVVLRKFNEGKDASQIAEEAGSSRQAVYHILKENNIQMSVPASEVASAMRKYCEKHNVAVNTLCSRNGVDTSFMYSKGMMHKQHADRILTILQRTPNVPQVKEALDPKRVATLKSQGFTNEEVAKELGVHIATVQRAIKKLKERATKKSV